MIGSKIACELVEDRRFDPKVHMTPEVSAPAKPERTQNAPSTQRAAAPMQNAAPKRLFLRVPSAKSREFYKALNLLEIFEGTFPAFFFYADEKRYDTEAHGFAISDYVITQFKALLGDENVILK